MVCLAGLIDRNHVWMVQSGGSSRFAHKSLAQFRRKQSFRARDLECHFALQLQVHSQVDHSEPPSAELAHDVKSAKTREWKLAGWRRGTSGLTLRQDFPQQL